LSRSGRFVEHADLLADPTTDSLQRIPSVQVLLCLQQRARFLQSGTGAGRSLPRGHQPRGGYSRALRRLDGGVHLLQGGGSGGHRRLSFTAGSRLSVGGLSGGLLCALAGVERLREREPVVSLRHGVVGLLECGRGGNELGRRVSFRARGTRGVDCPLGSVDLFLRRLGARGAEHKNKRAQENGQATHQGGKYNRDGVR